MLECSIHMKRFSLLAFVCFVVSAPLASQPKCSAPPAVVVFDVRAVRNNDTLVGDRAIEGSASKEGRPLDLTQVRLYSDGKLVRSAVTDKRGHFLLANLPVGHFRLTFRGLGAFDVEVLPPHMAQQAFYGFSRTGGCLSWGMDTN
jgi:hypothetical protein